MTLPTRFQQPTNSISNRLLTGFHHVPTAYQQPSHTPPYNPHTRALPFERGARDKPYGGVSITRERAHNISAHKQRLKEGRHLIHNQGMQWRLSLAKHNEFMD
ncbi:hypothetical protein ACVJBD_002427 [Rhizobium mongolense]